MPQFWNKKAPGSGFGFAAAVCQYATDATNIMNYGLMQWFEGFENSEGCETPEVWDLCFTTAS